MLNKQELFVKYKIKEENLYNTNADTGVYVRPVYCMT